MKNLIKIILISAAFSLTFANEYRVEIKDYVLNNTLYRYIIVFENDNVLFIKNCNSKLKILNEKEIEHCNKDRKTI